jgi:hypothetical protein
MSQLAPPRPPILVTIEDDGLRRLHFRLWQIVVTGITVLVTTWFVTFGAIPAILALMVAKHVLVAILVRGFDAPGGRPEAAPQCADMESPGEDSRLP